MYREASGLLVDKPAMACARSFKEVGFIWVMAQLIGTPGPRNLGITIAKLNPVLSYLYDM